VTTPARASASCFGTHRPFDDDQLDALYRNHGQYVSAVDHADKANVRAEYIVKADARQNHQDAVHSQVGK
jgi:Alpha/beta hydrolase domain